MKMNSRANFSGRQGGIKSIREQPCIRAVKRANLPNKLKQELEKFIERNKLPDCDKVSPHCLKAHMVHTAKKLRLRGKEIESLKTLFRARIGYKGFYLDAGELKRV